VGSEWSLPVDRELMARIEAERETFDRVAAARLRRLVPHRPSPHPSAWLDLRATPNPRLRSLLVEGLPGRPLESLVKGCRVLELGGSGEATPGFLDAGASWVDQLDVSPGMLELARARLTEDQRPRVEQHVAAAETLPFADDTFDIVYSRHCLHHMQRERVFPEVARVLAPTGWFLFIEPYLPRWIRGLVSLRRWLLRVDRGSDDPLTSVDLRHAERSFGQLRLGGTPNAAVLVRGLPPLAKTLARLQRQRPLPTSLIHHVGGRIMVLAQEPRACSEGGTTGRCPLWLGPQRLAKSE